MRKIFVIVGCLFIIWLIIPIYKGFVDNPDVSYEDGKIASIGNCDEDDGSYSIRCAHVVCEYELSKRQEVDGFDELRTIQSVTVSAIPGFMPATSKLLIEVLMDSEQLYYSCENDREKILKLEKTTKNEFRRKNNL